MKKAIWLVLLAVLLGASLAWAQTSNPPSLSSEVTVDTGNGFGSSGLYARRFANVDVNFGSDIILAQSATDGDSFTVNQNGVYAISYTDYSQFGDTGIISLNSSPSVTINSLTVANRLCAFSLIAGELHGCSVTIGLSAGDVIRGHRSIAGQADASSYVRFEITRVH